MKTDNINTMILPEDILAKYLKTDPDTYIAFLDGAIWQLGKDKAIIDKLVNTLKGFVDHYEQGFLTKEIFEKAKIILKEIEPDKQ